MFVCCHVCSRGSVLVKFDKPLRGPKDEQFRDLARNVGERGNGARFLVADVNVQGLLHHISLGFSPYLAIHCPILSLC